MNQPDPQFEHAFRVLDNEFRQHRRQELAGHNGWNAKPQFARCADGGQTAIGAGLFLGNANGEAVARQAPPQFRWNRSSSFTPEKRRTDPPLQDLHVAAEPRLGQSQTIRSGLKRPGFDDDR